PPMEVEVSSWSPDGKRIAFMGRSPNQPYRIYVVNRDGGGFAEAAEGDDNQGGPSWSRDGRTIVYGNVFGEVTQNGLIRRIDLASGKVQIVPRSNNFRTARWSPDGKYIAALRWQTRELMLLDVRTQRWKTLAGSITGDNIAWSSDSQFLYADSPRQEKPVLERVRVRDGRRTTVASLASLQKVQAGINWVGLTPDSAPVFQRMFTANEIYELKWADQ
ncbi:MAG: TolB family protein, partial [Terriglobales bacterium]